MVLVALRMNRSFPITYQTDCQKVGFCDLSRLLFFVGWLPIPSGRVERARSWCDGSADGLPNFISMSAENRLPVHFRLDRRFPVFHLDLIPSDHLRRLKELLMNFTKGLYKTLAECVRQVGLEMPVAFAGTLVVWPQFLGNIGLDLDDTNVWVTFLEVIGPCIRPIRT